MKFEKIYAEIGGFLIFLVLYLAFFNFFFRFKGAEYPVYAPGTLIFAFIGYWLGGLLYDKYLRKPG